MASKSLNHVQLIGNVTRDPELRYTPQGNAVATFGLATNRSWKTENGEMREEAEFHRLVAWNKLGELCAQLCNKGRKIYVSGRIQTRTFTGSDNIQRTITEIVIEDMILLDSRMAGAGTGMGSGMNYGQGQQVSEKTSNEEVTMPAEPADDLSAEADLATASMVEDTKAKTAKKKKTVEVEEEMVTEDKVNLDDIPF